MERVFQFVAILSFCILLIGNSSAESSPRNPPVILEDVSEVGPDQICGEAYWI